MNANQLTYGIGDAITWQAHDDTGHSHELKGRVVATYPKRVKIVLTGAKTYHIVTYRRIMPRLEDVHADSNPSTPIWRDCRQCGNPMKTGACTVCGAAE